MHIHGYPLIPMVYHGYPWLTMDIHGFLGFSGFLRISMVKHRFPWPFSGKNGPVYCVFTIIGALWEFSSGSSGSTGSSGIEVNPSKMDPWFPTPGSRMTVVFYKTPSNDTCPLKMHPEHERPSPHPTPYPHHFLFFVCVSIVVFVWILSFDEIWGKYFK